LICLAKSFTKRANKVWESTGAEGEFHNKKHEEYSKQDKLTERKQNQYCLKTEATEG
jgi:hypothetical protein